MYIDIYTCTFLHVFSGQYTRIFMYVGVYKFIRIYIKIVINIRALSGESDTGVSMDVTSTTSVYKCIYTYMSMNMCMYIDIHSCIYVHI
jgi:hypothetical protein